MKSTYGIAVAAALVVGAFTGAHFASGATTQSAFVPIVPCRLMDTRPTSQVGTNTTLGAGSVRTTAVRGTNGKCTGIPTTATGVAMNVTAVKGTASSYLTVWPAGATRPGTSNLNWVPGAPPTPNKVDVALGSTGKVSFYNLAGNVDVIADVTGYYEPVITAKGTVSSVQIVKQTITIVENAGSTGANGNAVAHCPAGMVAIAGGVENPVQVALNTRSSRPEPENSPNPTGWFGDVRSSTPGAAAYTATVYAVCITLNL
jgi:hypothetical protein